MTHHILTFGRTGQLGRALIDQADHSDVSLISISRSECDLAQTADRLRSFLESQDRPDAVILAAAYTAVDLAETKRETAYAVNHRAPKVISEYCREQDIPVVFVSTDYVFDGEKSSPYLETDKVAPINVYGASKLAGEESVSGSECRHVILRTSWVFDGQGKNFFTTMMKLAKTRKELNVVDDQYGRPTYAIDLAKAVYLSAKALIERDKDAEGIFHISGAGDFTSWAEFAKRIFDQTEAMRSHKMTVNAIPSSEYPTIAKRPKYSVMDTSKFEKIHNVVMPNWTDGLNRAIQEYVSNAKD
jgi:dTDP-4-dehydrorhamnose reductase